MNDNGLPADRILTIDEFNDAFIKLRPTLLAFASKLNFGLAEDLVNTTYVKVAGSLHRFDKTSNFRAYCFTILRNENATIYIENEIGK